MKIPILLMPAVGFKLTTPQSLSGGVTPRLTHRLNHLATEDWLQQAQLTQFLMGDIRDEILYNIIIICINLEFP